MAGQGTALATAKLRVNIFDGSRNPMPQPKGILITVIDGFKKTVYREEKNASSLVLETPFYDNTGDNYTVIAYASGYKQAGVFPVKIARGEIEDVDIMLLRKDAGFDFSTARWEALSATHPQLASLLAAGTVTQQAAKDRYTELLENRSGSLSCLLNILTVMEDIHLPAGTPLSYLRELRWDDTLEDDRFFAYADSALMDQVKRAAKQGMFKRQPGSEAFHPGATDSYKQTQFGEANLQLTFHEGDTRTIDGCGCVLVECDIDYYADLGAHALLEVAVNHITGSITNPRQVYVLRWMAGRRAGVAEFDPPYRIV